jgi:hypothetical protein
VSLQDIGDFMQVRIDYDLELVDYEKDKIKWLVEEFELLFCGCIKEVSDEEIFRGVEFLDYMISNIDVEIPEVANYLAKSLKRLENRYPIFF